MASRHSSRLSFSCLVPLLWLLVGPRKMNMRWCHGECYCARSSCKPWKLSAYVCTFIFSSFSFSSWMRFACMPHNTHTVNVKLLIHRCIDQNLSWPIEFNSPVRYWKRVFDRSVWFLFYTNGTSVIKSIVHYYTTISCSNALLPNYYYYME